MYIYFTTIFFLLGLVLASFLNALLYRIDKEYKYPDIFIKGSHCEKCKKQLTWYELIPILSYVIFRGKCSKCGYHIPPYYPISELLLGLGFAGIYFTDTPPYFYILMLFLFAMSYFDRIYNGVPKNIVHMFLIYALLVPGITMLTGGTLSIAILTAILISLFIFLTGKILKKPFGLGDTLVLLGLGFLLSNTQYIIFVYMLLLLSFIYVILLLAMRKISLKSKIPLLPFMFASIVLTISLQGPISEILSKYLYI